MNLSGKFTQAPDADEGYFVLAHENVTPVIYLSIGLDPFSEHPLKAMETRFFWSSH